MIDIFHKTSSLTFEAVKCYANNIEKNRKNTVTDDENLQSPCLNDKYGKVKTFFYIL